MMADRVNAVEGVVQDLAGGRVPNVFAESGWKAEWQHNRAHLVGRVLLKTVAVSAVVGMIAAASRARAGSHRDQRPTETDRRGLARR
jgi:hypothetical protein